LNMASSPSSVRMPAQTTTTKDILHTGPNCGSFIWTISSKRSVSAMLSASNGQLFESRPFVMASLLWTIRLYPNGNNVSSAGSVKIFLKLVSMPSCLQSLHLSYTTSCPQSMASSTALDIYLKSGDSKGWLNRSLLLSEWKRMKLKYIRIAVSVNIFRVRLHSKHAHAVLGHFRFNQALPSKSCMGKQRFSYKLDAATLEKFRHSHYGKRYESAIFDKQWRIRWFPNGANRECAQFMSIYLVLCKVPAKTARLTTKYRIICKELNRSISAVDDFSFSASNWGKSKFIGLAEIEHLDALTFIVELEVLEEVSAPMSNEHEDVWDATQIAYTLSMSPPSAQGNDDHLFLGDYPSSSNGSVHSVPVSPRMQRSDRSKKEIKSLRKQMVLKDKEMESLSRKVESLRAQQSEGVRQRETLRESVIAQVTALSANGAEEDEKRSAIEELRAEVAMLKQNMARLQSAVGAGQARDLGKDSTKRMQLKWWMQHKLELPQYFDCVVQHGFEDLTSLRDLDKDSLAQIGIEKLGHQLKILRCIRTLQMEQNQMSQMNVNQVNEFVHPMEQMAMQMSAPPNMEHTQYHHEGLY